MADHFEEVVHLRLGALETRVDDEAEAVKEHFDEQRRFLTESLNKQTTELRAEMGALRDELRAELRAEIGGLRDELRADLRAEAGSLRAEIGELRRDVHRLEQRVGAYQDSHQLEHARFEQKMDARFDAVHLVLRDILRRLPLPPSPGV